MGARPSGAAWFCSGRRQELESQHILHLQWRCGWRPFSTVRPRHRHKERRMKHLKLISQRPQPAQQSQVSGVESLILLVLSLLFRTWDNFSSVYQSLQKYYQKTP